jgi:hypothetical protein
MDKLRQAILEKLDLAGVQAYAPMAFTKRQADLLRQAADSAASARRDRLRESLSQLMA